MFAAVPLPFHVSPSFCSSSFSPCLSLLQPDHPHADVLTSFFSELLAEIAEIGQFSYNLRVMPSGTKYGGAVGETQPEGLIGEVYNNVRTRATFPSGGLCLVDRKSRCPYHFTL